MGTLEAVARRLRSSPASAIAAGIGLVAAVIATMTYFRVAGDRETPGFAEVLVWQVVVWAPWGAIAVLVFRLARRLPVKRGARASWLLAHLLASMAIALAHAAWFIAVSSRFSPFLGAEGTKYGVYRFFFLFWIQLDLLLYWAVLGLAFSRRYLHEMLVRERKAARLQLELVQAQLEALKLQLQPHFLFNTLNTIVAMMRSDEHEKALNMCLALSDMLRLVLDYGRANEIALSRELRLLDKYLEIQLYRFEDRLSVVKRVDAGVLEARVPSLFLQPIVENAVQHGVTRSSRPGSIGISARREGASLIVEVTNDLVQPHDATGAGHGIGLANTRSRLEELYGERQRLEIRTTSERRTLVRVSLPWQEEPRSREVEVEAS